MQSGFETAQVTQHQCFTSPEKQRVLMNTGVLGEPNEPPLRNPRAGVRHVQAPKTPIFRRVCRPRDGGVLSGPLRSGPWSGGNGAETLSTLRFRGPLVNTFVRWNQDADGGGLAHALVSME